MRYDSTGMFHWCTPRRIAEAEITKEQCAQLNLQVRYRPQTSTAQNGRSRSILPSSTSAISELTSPIFISILYSGSYRCLSAWCWCRYAYAWPSKFYHAASCLEFSLSRIEDYCDIGRCKIYSKRMGNLNMFSKSPCSFWKENVAYHRLFFRKNLIISKFVTIKMKF